LGVSNELAQHLSSHDSRFALGFDSGGAQNWKMEMVHNAIAQKRLQRDQWVEYYDGAGSLDRS